jgi:hypothetical protein
MLRTNLSGATVPTVLGDPENQIPGPDQPFTTEDRAIGIRFYRLKEGFFLPYHRLQSIQFTADRITIRFQSEDVHIDGRGLHALYVGLARQSVARVVQQGERGKASTCITCIERVPRTDTR